MGITPLAGKVRARRARPGDRAAMLAITRDVWGGDDYFPSVWADWVTQSQGVLQAAVIDGRVVGFQHITPHHDGSCWLEGIRVAEEVQGKGIARALLDEGIQWARSEEYRAVRLSTAGGNPASNRLASGAGFRVVASFQALRTVPLESRGRTESVRIAGAWDFDQVWEFVRRNATAPFYSEGWTFYHLTDAILLRLLARNCVAVMGGISIEGVVIAQCKAPFEHLTVGMIDGSGEAVRTLCWWLRDQAFRTGLEQIRATIPVPEAIAPSVHETGFHRDYDFDVLLYELAL